MASSLEIRRKVVRLLTAYSNKNKEDYVAFMTAAHAHFHFRERQGLTLQEQISRVDYVHSAVDSLVAEDDSDFALLGAHSLIHELSDMLAGQQVENPDLAIEDEDDKLLEQYEDAFRFWEQDTNNTEE